jgi:hypothetical protein
MMDKENINKIVVSGLLLLLLGAGFIPVSGSTTCNEYKTASIRGNSINMTAGQPTQTGKWTVHITHTGTTTSGTPYTNGTWTFTIPTDPSMTPTEKAKKMEEEINKKSDCPLTATSSGPNVKVTADNGKIYGWKSTSTDGQMVHGTNPSLLGTSFMGTSSTGTVTVDVGGMLATTPTDGKTLAQIHNDLNMMLMGLGIPTMIDPSGLALYIMVPFPNVGLGSDDAGLAAYGVFYEDPSIEPFGVCVGMLDTFAGNSGSSVTVEFEICNFIFAPNTYHVTATDQLGWTITPDDFMCDLLPGKSDSFEFLVDIPPVKAHITNIINVTATAINMPWVSGSGLVQIIVNHKPDAPVIDGLLKGKIGKPYDYTFNATDPDGDTILYFIDWNDNTTTGWIGPYNSGEEVVSTHTWTEKGNYIIKAKAKDPFGEESDWGTLEITMPKSSALSFNMFFQQLFERFPHIFPILRHLMG